MRITITYNKQPCHLFPTIHFCKNMGDFLLGGRRRKITIRFGYLLFRFLPIILSLAMMPTYQEAGEEKSVEPTLPSLASSYPDSQYHERYVEFMGKNYQTEREGQLRQPSLLERFTRYGIEYDPSNEFVHRLRLTVESESINSEVMAFLAYWGKFRIKFTVLHSETPSCSHRQQKNEGSFGKVYTTSFLRCKFALKCIPYQAFQNQRTAKIMAIKQFLLLKLAAALRVGPEVENYFGFDIVMYKNCAQFAMEVCTKIQNPSQQIMSSLKQSLYRMHSFGFVHIDIKPENIMLSQFFKKPVFIDFGLSELISAPIGKKLSFNYRGTLLYCGEEMVKSFETESQLQMDLYYNDCQGLRKSITAMQQKEEFCEIFFEEEDHENQPILPNNKDTLNSTQIVAIPLKYCMFKDQISSLFYIVECNPHIATRNLYKILLLFLKQLPITQNLKWFYQSVHPFYQQGLELLDIKEAYSSTANHFHTFSINQDRKAYFMKEYCHTGGQMQHLEANYFRKNELEAFLMSPQSIKAVKRDVYYKRFMDYISFSNNVYSVTMKQRTAVALICLEELKPNKDIDNPQLNDLNNKQAAQDLTLVKEVVGLLLASILQNYKKEGNFDKIQEKEKKNLIFALLQHNFILRIGTASSLSYLLQTVYTLTARTDQDKFQMLLKVKDYNTWFYYRVQTELVDSDSYELAVQNWRVGKWRDLQGVFQKFKQGQINPHLATTTQIDIILAKMKANSFNQFKDYRLLLPILQANNFGIYRFYFQLFEIEHDKNENPERCRQISRFIDKNIACDQIMKELRLTKKAIWMGRSKDEYFAEQLCEFIDNVQSARVLMKEAMTIDQSLQKILVVNRLNGGRFYQQSTVSELRAKLRKIVPSASLSTFFSLNEVHRCISTVLINNLLNIRLSYEQLICSTTPYNQMIEQIEKTIECISCNRCKEAIKLTSLFLKQNYLLKFAYDQKLEQQFISNYKKAETIITKSHFKVELISQSLMNRFLFSKYCLLNPHLQEKYQAALILYKAIREQDIFIEYVANQFNVNKILEVALFRVHQNYGLTQFIRFIDRMSLCVGQNYSYRFFRTLEESFEEVVKRLGGKLDFNLLCEGLLKVDRKRQTSEANKSNYFNIIYYYAIIIHCEQAKIIKKICKRLCEALACLPKLISRIYQSNFYRFIIFQLMKEMTFTEQSRKIISLKRKIMKIYNIERIASGLTFKKMSRNNQLAFQILQRKALLLSGPLSSTAEKEYQYVRIKKTPF